MGLTLASWLKAGSWVAYFREVLLESDGVSEAGRLSLGAFASK